MPKFGPTQPALEITPMGASESYITVYDWSEWFTLIQAFDATRLMSHVGNLRIITVKYNHEKELQEFQALLHDWTKQVHSGVVADCIAGCQLSSAGIHNYNCSLAYPDQPIKADD